MFKNIYSHWSFFQSISLYQQTDASIGFFLEKKIIKIKREVQERLHAKINPNFSPKYQIAEG